MSIQCRSREWSSAAATFTPPTAVFIATASNSVPSMLLPTSIENASGGRNRVRNGASAAALRAITFSVAPCCSGKSGWVLIFRTSEKPHPRKERTRRQLLARALRLGRAGTPQALLRR
jgi:hypothetical protein